MKKTQIIVSNRKAFHDYHIIERYEAGISLLGSEVKAIRAGKIQIKDAWVDISQHDEAYLKQATILRLPHMIFQHEPERVRKLLLKKNEIARLNTSCGEKGMTLVVLKVYLKNRLIKLEIASAKGKKLYDKRAANKAKEAKREIERTLKKIAYK